MSRLMIALMSNEERTICEIAERPEYRHLYISKGCHVNDLTTLSGRTGVYFPCSQSVSMS